MLMVSLSKIFAAAVIKSLKIAEDSAKERGYKEIHVHLGKEYLESHFFYPKYGYEEYKDLYMKKKI